MKELVVRREKCRLCASGNISMAVPLAPVPILSPNVGRNEATTPVDALTAPIDLYLCHDCGLLQLLSIIDSEFQYANFSYRTSVSLGLTEHFAQFASDSIDALALQQGSLVLDIGSNDGTLLRFFKDKGMRVVGVDPAVRIAAEATAGGIPTVATFFTAGFAREFLAEWGPARLIVSNNTMANLDDLDDMIAGIRLCMAPDGVYIFETQYALDVLEKTLLDVIYHEHVSYFAVKPLAAFFCSKGLEIIDVERISPKGGSIRVTVQHAGGQRPVSPRVANAIDFEIKKHLFDLNIYRRFADKVSDLRNQIHAAIDRTQRDDGIVAAYGSSVGCASLINQFDLADRIQFIVDDTPFTEELIGPGYNLPIFNRETMVERSPGLVIILAWRYAEPIVQKNSAYLASGGRFLIPLPDVGYLP